MEQEKNSVKQRKWLKIAVDLHMMAALILAMSREAVGNAFHEWIGLLTFALFVTHHVLNRGWYRTLVRRKQSTYRIVLNAIDALLLFSFVMTALCGMAMSSHALPFLHGMLNVSFARKLLMSVSHWTYLLTGAHVGMHLPGMLPKKWRTGSRHIVFLIASACVCGVGIWLASRNGSWSSLLLRSADTFYGSGKHPLRIMLAQILIFTPGVFAGMHAADILRGLKRNESESGFLRLFSIVLAIAVWIACMLLDPVL